MTTRFRNHRGTSARGSTLLIALFTSVALCSCRIENSSFSTVAGATQLEAGVSAVTTTPAAPAMAPSVSPTSTLPAIQPPPTSPSPAPQPPAPAPAPESVPAALTLLPLGDSNTYGITAQGYRGYLAQLLQSQGLSVQFVGSATDDRGGMVLQHDGFPGWASDDLLNGASGISPMNDVATLKPSAILLMAGTNDLLVKHDSLSQAESNLRQLIDRIRALSPASRIFVATILPWVDVTTSPRLPLQIPGSTDDLTVAAFNQWLRSEIATRGAAGEPISVIDMYSFFSLEWSADGIHANDEGYHAIAEAWYADVAPWIAATQGKAPVPCVSNQAARAYVTVAVRYLAAAAQFPAARADALSYYPTLNSGIDQLVQGNWSCAATLDLSNRVTAITARIHADLGQ